MKQQYRASCSTEIQTEDLGLISSFPVPQREHWGLNLHPILHFVHLANRSPEIHLSKSTYLPCLWVPSLRMLVDEQRGQEWVGAGREEGGEGP